MKSAIVAVLASVLVWALIVPVFHLVYVAGGQSGLGRSLLIAVAGALVVYAILVFLAKTPQWSPPLAFAFIVPAVVTAMILFALATFGTLSTSGKPQATVVCGRFDPALGRLDPIFHSGGGDPETNELNHLEILEWEIVAPKGTDVTIQFQTKKGYPKCQAVSPFDDGNKPYAVTVPDNMGSKIASKPTKDVKGCFTYVIKCAVPNVPGPPDEIDPMIAVPRPPGYGGHGWGPGLW